MTAVLPAFWQTPMGVCFFYADFLPTVSNAVYIFHKHVNNKVSTRKE